MHAALMVVVLGWLGSSAGGEDKELLEVLKAAQKHNLDRYPSGELKAKVTWGQRGAVPSFGYAETHAIWSAHNVWADVRRWDDHRHEVDPSTTEDTKERLLIDGKRVVFYHPDARQVEIVSRAGREISAEVNVTPAAGWYGPFGMDGFSWLGVLDPKPGGGLDVSKVTFAVRRLSEDLVEVVRTESQYGGSIRMVFSLVLDGNVIAFEFKEPASDYSSKGSCEWERDREGNLVLRKSRHDGVSHHDGKEFRLSRQYETITFDPHARPKRNQFTLDGLNLPQGVRINDHVTGKARRLGDAPIERVLDSMNALIETMRARGFATGK